MSLSYNDFNAVSEEQRRIFPEEVQSEFEKSVKADIYKWFITLPDASTLRVGENVTEAYWKQKLN